MWKVARFIRKEILDRDQWVLLGTSNHVENETRRKAKVLTVPYQWFVSTSFRQPKIQDR